MRFIYGCFLALTVALSAAQTVEQGNTVSAAETSSPTANEAIPVYRVELKGPINSPLEFVVRRALKEAIEHKVEYVVMEMDTPGGDGETMFNIMEMIQRFPGKIITYVNDEAISAGALIAFVSHEVYFAPTAVIGASAPITATGGEINPTLQAKLLSYIRARLRALKAEDPLAANVLEAMVDINYELEIDGQVISPKGELLTLSAAEASKFYLDPPRRLLGNGIAQSIEDVLKQSLPGHEWQIVNFEKTWSEQLALYTTSIAPLLFGVGIFLIIIEIKTPGFGLPGIVGIALLILTLIGQNAAGLAGHETILIILLGFILLAVELFIMPGSLVFGILGVLAVFGGLVYAMSDIWPAGSIDTNITLDTFLLPIQNALLAFLISGVALFLLLRNMRGTWIGRKLILETEVGKGPQYGASSASDPVSQSELQGSIGIALTPMSPSGVIEIDGRRLDAISESGFLEKGTRVVIKKIESFHVVVQKMEKA